MTYSVRGADPVASRHRLNRANKNPWPRPALFAARIGQRRNHLLRVDQYSAFSDLCWPNVSALPMERRKSPRHEVDRPAKIILPSGEPLPVRIENESEGGAKLRVKWSGWLPRAFDLEDVFTGARRAVQTVWQHFSSMGVRYRNGKPSQPHHHDFGHRRKD